MYISSLKLSAIQKAALHQCDALDGVKDGIINNPEKCHFDPSVLLCKGAESQECVTQPQLDSLRKYYNGGTDGQGKLIFPGLVAGDELGGWRAWVLGGGPGSGSGVGYVQNYFRYMVMNDPKWNILTADVHQSLEMAKEKTAADLDATNPDLSKFAARGGKLILYHGWNDPAISPWNTIAYYKSVQKQMGGQADSFIRLYMAPGVEHCVSGPGPSSFGQLGISTARGPKFGIFDVLEDWVEKGTPAAEVIATKYAPDRSTVLMTRPLCPYPKVAVYKGSGGTNDAANFVCGN
jgi:feruloyl esterase